MSAVVTSTPSLRRWSALISRCNVRRLGTTIVAILLLLWAWSLFAPTAIGGPASYVVTDGTSMLPHFKADGLVITQTRSSYHVGEVVAYHNHQLNRVVMHRIVAMDGDRYVFKGDNNSYDDQYHATKADLVGQEWVYWPGGGRYLNLLRNPVTFALVIAVITLLAFLTPKRGRRRRRHHAQT
jgi:signal peptidase I